MSVIPEHVIEDLNSERAYQLSRGAKGKLNAQDGWDFSFDNKNTPNDWLAYINIYLGRAVGIQADESHEERVAKFRQAMVKVATLAVAAVEAVDRNNTLPKRHYDK